ncbi:MULTISPECIES: tRNA1(Val) (adenine(37)-N6)-methyltransferase [unclassified Fusibacter]|uniref:tRNA1(Val) (adenine(37)-N6)-methyltransferase n=1 Tax=unclassified Fusibacter TaxID=2624464 RepID=UPI001011FAF0|nr:MULTISPECIES: tRNA1(Val) (adenine(37)-N6)-methyltransferase [unclassified Fusibacter]MCK8059218.1 tRNA1(Val) (adenine(37)-N6)-methyltransferase [Fusibacter sp. A2]NPE21318.1 tRNA1(Val) (adenine(37)-N6)-methyltransferase [Fusibacter sp. A1]RXV62581.1 tRNA1(Val) (adenine(37)-N6)-methyltransferase [Fusibacter sp. A1]
MLKDGERLDDLQVNGLQIIQNKKWFSFGIDAVLLANWTEIRKNNQVMDLGTGTAIVPLLIVGKSDAKHITGVELQAEVAEMADRTVKHNKLSDRITIVTGDIKEVPTTFSKGCMDVVTSNPPYFKVNGGIKNESDYKTISRHEVACSLEDIFKAAFHVLKPNGRFYLVHRPDRLVDIVEIARKMRLEPKRIQFVQPKFNSRPNIMLMKFVKYGNHELKFEDPIVVYDEDGGYTEMIYSIYRNASITVFGEKE